MRATKNAHQKDLKVGWLGIPDHQGIVNVGGRVGADKGPEAFRRLLGKFNGRIPVKTMADDLGDVAGLTPDVHQNHQQAALAIEHIHTKYLKSLIIGGGHDHGYSQLLGVSKALRGKSFKLGCINVDAHLDLRKPEPLITSGSPFYLAIENGVLRPEHFVEFGIQPQCNSAQLWDYASKKKIKVEMFQSLRFGKALRAFQLALNSLSKKVDALVVSLDLDAVQSSQAPGVSAPQSEGFDTATWLAFAELAGRHPKVVSLGLFELSPPHDRDDLTAKLAATTAYRFFEECYGHTRN